MGPDGARNQERLCWRGPAAIYWTGLARHSPADNDVSTEAEDIVGIRYQATASEDIEDFNMCCSEK
jgi:hypothetical protein